MKTKWFFTGILSIMLVFGLFLTGCGDGGGDNGGGGGGGSGTGLYVGIVGFNKNVTPRNISLLNTGNKTQFQGFIDNLTIDDATGLYYAVDTGIDMLEAATLPNDLINVSVVTFTDGLDNASTAINTNYASRDAYRDAVKTRLSSTKVENLNIDAHSIGIRGGDVVDTAAFTAGLNALASNKGKATEASSMAEVESTFKEIADSLYKESQAQSIRLRLSGGYDDGNKIRFTFDNVTDAANSNLYIEGTFRKSGNARSLESVVYQGLTSSSGTTVTGEISSVYVYFTFENTKTTSDSPVSMTNVQQWEYVTSESRWQPNSEFGKTGDTETKVDKKSAVIILVLDCTTSLTSGGKNGFNEMKTAAKNFIDILVSGNSGGGGATIPGTPTGAAATAQSASSIRVSWNAVSGATGYYIYRSPTSGGTYSQVGTSASTSYTNTGLSASTTYYYKVAAYNGAGTGTQSGSVSATTHSSGGGPQPGGSVVELGDYTYTNPDEPNQRGWESDGVNLRWTDIVNAKYLVLIKDGGNADGLGGLQVFLQGNGNNMRWAETQVSPDFTPFSGTAYIVIQLNSLSDYSSFTNGTSGKIGIAGYPLTDLGIVTALLTDAEMMPKPAGAVDLSYGGTTYGYIVSDIEL